MIGCLWTHVHTQQIIALYFESETELKFYNLQAWSLILIDHEIFSMVILLLLVQEGLVSFTSKSMHKVLINILVKLAQEQV